MFAPSTLASKRLVVFGCGYVGTAVARQGIAAGLRVEALTRNVQRARELEALGVRRVVVGDLAASDWHEAIEPGADLVLNCVSSGGSGLAGYRRAYVDGMHSVLALARRGAVGTLLYTSSTSVYAQSGGVRVDEAMPADGTGGTGRVLVEAENVLRGAGTGCDRWFILRLAGIYGPGRHHLLDQLRGGVAELSGGGAHRLNLAHLDDICAAVWAALASPPSSRNEIFNVADDRPVPKAEVVAWLADRLGRPAPRFSGEASAGRRAGSPPPDRIIANARLKAALGWRPRFADFRAGYAAILSA